MPDILYIMSLYVNNFCNVNNFYTNTNKYIRINICRQIYTKYIRNIYKQIYANKFLYKKKRMLRPYRLFHPLSCQHCVFVHSQSLIFNLIAFRLYQPDWKVLLILHLRKCLLCYMAHMFVQIPLFERHRFQFRI